MAPAGWRAWSVTRASPTSPHSTAPGSVGPRRSPGTRMWESLYCHGHVLRPALCANSWSRIHPAPSDPRAAQYSAGASCSPSSRTLRECAAPSPQGCLYFRLVFGTCASLSLCVWPEVVYTRTVGALCDRTDACAASSCVVVAHTPLPVCATEAVRSLRASMDAALVRPVPEAHTGGASP